MAPNQAREPDEPEDELLAATQADGTPTGIVKPRAMIHTDGDWHRTRTVWVVLTHATGGPALVLQKRGPFKEAWPGRLDVSSAGHVRSGDTDMWREVEEEVGRRPDQGETVALGERRVESASAEGRVDREIQELWLWRCPLDLRDLQPPFPEVEALLAVAPVDLRRLVRREVRRIPALVRRPESPRIESGHAPADALIPGDAAYFLRVCELTERILTCKPWTPFSGDALGRARARGGPLSTRPAPGEEG